jgi:hypothetical protein
VNYLFPDWTCEPGGCPMPPAPLVDTDGDGVFDDYDNCPMVANPTQANADFDREGDACDSSTNSMDSDRDGVPDVGDNCPMAANPTQQDADRDGVGDACDMVMDPDTDSDGVIDARDNCPMNANPMQQDADMDGQGDACDATPMGMARFALLKVKTGRCLYDNGGDVRSTTSVRPACSAISSGRCSTPGSGRRVFRNLNSMQCLAASNWAGTIGMAACNMSSAAQQWALERYDQGGFDMQLPAAFAQRSRTTSASTPTAPTTCTRRRATAGCSAPRTAARSGSTSAGTSRWRPSSPERSHGHLTAPPRAARSATLSARPVRPFAARTAPRAAALSLLLAASSCHRQRSTVTALAVARAPRAPSVDAATVVQSPVLDAPLFYGSSTVVARPVAGRASLIAGNLRVEVSDDGSVHVATEAPATRIRWHVSLGADRWAFVTSEQQVLVSDTFLGPFVAVETVRSPIIRHATGAVAAVRLDDGEWLRVDASGVRSLSTAGDGVIAVHFVDSTVGYAIRAPGVVLHTRDGGEQWTELALDRDVAIDFDLRSDGALLVRAGRGLYAIDGDRLAPSAAVAQEAPTVEPAVAQRAVERWEAHWRAHLWPAGASYFWLSNGAENIATVEHRDALFWWHDGAVHRLGRDGRRSHSPVADARFCALRRFGPKLLAHCKSPRETGDARVIELDSETLAQHTLVPALRDFSTVHPSTNGYAILFGAVASGTSDPERAIWTRDDPRLRPLPMIDRDARVVVDWPVLLMVDHRSAQFARLDAASPRLEHIALRSEREPSTRGPDVWSFAIRGDGGYAILRRAEPSDTCELVLGTGPTPSARTLVRDCVNPTGVAFVDERFGVITERFRTRITRDAGAHWTDIARSTGVDPDAVDAQLLRLPAPRVDGTSIVLSPHRRIERRPLVPEGDRDWDQFGACVARESDDGDPVRADSAPYEPQRCARSGRSTSRPGPSPAADTRTIALAHQRTRVTVRVDRAPSPRVTVLWSGEDTGPGRFEGAPPWREPEADFDRANAVGYVVRGASRAGVLLERCLLVDGAARAHEPRACDVRWLRRDGRAIAMDLQNPPPGAHGAWVVRAAADGGGWVVELGSAQRRRLISWKQWQLWRPDATIDRWGDLVRDWQLEERHSLARVDGRWGVVSGVEFHGYEARAPELLHALVDGGFCQRRALPAADVWVASSDDFSVAPLFEGLSRWTAVLRRVDTVWCIERAYEWQRWFEWTTVERPRDALSWAIVADRSAIGARGEALRVRADSTVDSSRVQCEPRVPVSDEPEYY